MRSYVQKLTDARIVAGAFLLSLTAFAFGGTFARYVADDYCTASILLQHGLVGAQVFWYTTWSGRFSFILLVDALNALGSWTVPLTPLVLIVGFVIVSAAAIHPAVARIAARDARFPTLLLALALVTATLATASGLWEVLYWQTGSITYLLPVVILMAYVGVFWQTRRAWLQHKPTAPWIAAGAVLIVIAVGCSETSMALLIGTLSLAILGLRLLYRGADRPILMRMVGVSLAVGLIAAALVVISPGNSLRSVYFDRPPLALGAAETLWFPFYLVYLFALHNPLYLIVAYSVPFVLIRRERSVDVRCTPGDINKLRRLAMGVGFVAIAAAGAPSFFVGGGAPNAGAIVIPQFVLIVLIMACGFLDGLASGLKVRGRYEGWQRRAATIASGAVTLVVLLAPVLTTISTFVQASELQAHAAGLDEMDRQARQARANGDTSPTIIDAMLAPTDLSSDPTLSPNSCIAMYYGLEAIRLGVPQA